MITNLDPLSWILNTLSLDLSLPKAELSSLVKLSLLRFLGSKMSFLTLFKKSSTSGKLDLGDIQLLVEEIVGRRSSAVWLLSSGFLPWWNTARRIRVWKLSRSSIVFCQLTSFGVGQNAGPFVKRERSASERSQDVKLMGCKSGRFSSLPCGELAWRLECFLISAFLNGWFLVKRRFLVLDSSSRGFVYIYIYI